MHDARVSSDEEVSHAPEAAPGGAIHGLADSVEASVGLGAVEDFGDANFLLEDEVEHAVVANAHAIEGRIVVAPQDADVRARPGSAGTLRRGTSSAGTVLRIR